MSAKNVEMPIDENKSKTVQTKNHRRFWLWFDRALSHNVLKQAGLLACLFIVLFVMSFVLLSFSGSDWRCFCHDKNLSEWLLPLYLLIDTNALNGLYFDKCGPDGWMLFASSLTYLAGLFVFNGMIISLMTNAVNRRIERHHEGRIHYLLSGHYVILGFDEMCLSVIADIFKKDADAYILLLTSSDVETVREYLKRNLGEQHLSRVIVNYGHRTNAEEYGKIHLENSVEVFVVGNRSLPAHDAMNVECVDSICAYLKTRNEPARHPGRITCVFEDLDTYAAFKTSEIFGEVAKLGIEFVPYNFYTGWAKQVFVEGWYKGVAYPSVYGAGIAEEDDRFVHLVFVGTTYFAVAFAMEAAQVLHFPNAGRRKTRITFIDLNADVEMNIFKTRNRHFFEVQPLIYRDMSGSADVMQTEEIADSRKGFLDVEFEFIKGDVFSPQVQDELCRWAQDKSRCLSVFLAMANQRNNFAIGMNMPDAVYDNKVNIFIRQDRSDNFVTNLRTADWQQQAGHATFDTTTGQVQSTVRRGRYARIYPFGMNDAGYSSNDNILKQAKLINYLYATADYNKVRPFKEMDELIAIPENKIWAKADKLWRKLPVAHKWSNLYCAYNIRVKTDSLWLMRKAAYEADTKIVFYDEVMLTDAEIESLARVEHNRWNVEKLLMGYRKARFEEDKYAYKERFGKEGEATKTLGKNKKLFIHHDIRPYDELDNIRILDEEICRYIPWLLKMTRPKFKFLNAHFTRDCCEPMG